MRVISGSARGTVLVAPEGMGTRPTTDRIKENIFNMIQHEIRDAKVLDLFSGSGALAIEALSRGASRGTLVETDRKCYTVINKNLEKTRLLSVANVMAMDVMTALDRLANDNQSFDLVFIDPPYSKGWETPVLHKLHEKGLVRAGGLVILEHDSADEIVRTIGRMTCEREKRYGRTTISLFREGA